MIFTIMMIVINVIWVSMLIFSKVAENKWDKYSDLYYYGKNLTNEQKETYKNKTDKWHDIHKRTDLSGLSTYSVSMIITLIIGIYSFFIISGILLFSRLPVCVNKQVEKLEIERSQLVYRLENDEDIGIGNELLYNDILDFNKKIHDYKYDRENPWTSWFVDPAYTEIEMIDYEKDR